ncbi:Gpi1-domain-containing protein [Testicularia cyperi]|uniref:Gpi1-domain-containing protein n=1 Tax=Testicularia cyperi TaxID=1882483 RepID=A0A317XY08_9BASI|nr:Gpi1-domain-containing protein [Testicularia cyperi]
MSGHPVESFISPSERETDNHDHSAVSKVLVFWPSKLKRLDDHGSRAASALREDSCQLLLGKIVPGNVREVAVVVYGTAAPSAGTYSNAFGLGIVGSLRHQLRHEDGKAPQSRSISDHSVYLSAVQAENGRDLPRLEYVNLRSETHPITKITKSDASQLSCSISLIRYNAPNTRMLQHFSLEPLRLGPVSGEKLIRIGSLLLIENGKAVGYRQACREVYAPTKLEAKFYDLLLLDPLRWTELKEDQPRKGSFRQGTALRRAIGEINMIQARLGTRAKTSGRPNGSLSPSSDTVGNENDVSASHISVMLEGLLTSIKALLNYSLRTVPAKSGEKRQSNSLVTHLASAKQLNLRISQLLIVPRLASRLRRLRKQQKLETAEIAAPYIGLWNAVWLIANDVILGHALSLILLQYRSQIAELVRPAFQTYFLDGVLWLLDWLANWPAGLKLNTQLSLFFGDAYSSLTGSWRVHFLSLVLPRLENVIVGMALAGRVFGVTMVLCLLQDLLTICTLHITAFYTLSFRTMRMFVYVLSALYDLFRGKKRNALRGGRLDNASYELDQLLLGTTLFTLMAFLFPTIYVYYLAFGLVRLGVVGFQAAVIETCLGLLNHLPLFALMLRIKDPHRLPKGIWLEPTADSTSHQSPHRGYLETGRYVLRSNPLTLADIFEGYAEHVGGIQELPRMVLRCLLGRPLRHARSRNS